MAGAAGEGSPELWLDEHGDALYAYAMMRVHNPAVAEDLVQETLLAALVARSGFKAAASERTWLVGILRHKTIDHLRRASREQSLDVDFEDNGELVAKFDDSGHWQRPPAHWSNPAFVAENVELRQQLLHCIERLPEKLRMLMVLREIDGYSTSELLAMLAISSSNNLWVMLSRGRERVRACLETSWEEGR